MRLYPPGFFLPGRYTILAMTEHWQSRSPATNNRVVDWRLVQTIAVVLSQPLHACESGVMCGQVWKCAALLPIFQACLCSNICWGCHKRQGGGPRQAGCGHATSGGRHMGSIKCIIFTVPQWHGWGQLPRGALAVTRGHLSGNPISGAQTVRAMRGGGGCGSQ